MSRFAKIAAKLPEYGLDAMMITSAPNRLYATGFKSSAGVAVITAEASYFFVDSRYIEAAGNKIQGAEIREMNKNNPYEQLVGEVIAKHGVKKMGYEESYITVASFNNWKEKLSCELVPATQLVMDLRSIKDEEEIGYMIAAQRIAEKALQEVLNFIKVGRTEKEISAFLQYQLQLNGAERNSFDPIIVSGPNSSMPHGVPSDKPVNAGDFITMDFGCMLNGYCSDMTRTVAVGHVTEEMDKVYHTVLKAQLAGIAIAKAGTTGKAIHEAAAKVIADAGYGPYFGHGFGHGIGVEVHEQPSANPSNDKPMPVGAVISAEPGIYLPGKFGVRIEDCVVIQENDCLNLMKAPKELIIL